MNRDKMPVCVCMYVGRANKDTWYIHTHTYTQHTLESTYISLDGTSLHTHTHAHTITHVFTHSPRGVACLSQISTFTSTVAILFITPTRVYAVAEMTLRQYHPQYEIPHPTKHDRIRMPRVPGVSSR
jgi:hypothetical protein